MHQDGGLARPQSVVDSGPHLARADADHVEQVGAPDGLDGADDGGVTTLDTVEVLGGVVDEPGEPPLPIDAVDGLDDVQRLSSVAAAAHDGQLTHRTAPTQGG